MQLLEPEEQDILDMNGKVNISTFQVYQDIHRESHEQCVISRCQAGVEWKVRVSASPEADQFSCSGQHGVRWIQ